MNIQQTANYNRVAEAIEFIRSHFREQPNLDEVAEKVHLSPYHFQRLFTEWAGVSPKKFIQYLTIEYAKTILREKQANLFDAAFEAGLSGTGRLHDLFINIEGMTPAEYRNGGEALTIHYSFAESPFGNIIVASTPKVISHMAFADEEAKALAQLQQQFPNASYRQVVDMMQQNVLYIFTKDWSSLSDIKLHLKGTPFQIKVWEALLKIPMGALSSYHSIARAIGSSGASRAVGSAVGDNPIAFLIPCHRVIRSTGEIGHYHWGSTRKTAMIGWELAKTGPVSTAPEKVSH